MKNAQIIANSLNEWASPIVEGAMNSIAQQSPMGYFISGLIAPQRLINSLQQYIAAPVLMEYISKLPEGVIPDFALDIIDGMIETRVKDGALQVPFMNTSLGAGAFRELKKICQKNLSEYGEANSEGVEMEADGSDKKNK